MMVLTCMTMMARSNNRKQVNTKSSMSSEKGPAYVRVVAKRKKISCRSQHPKAYREDRYVQGCLDPKHWRRNDVGFLKRWRNEIALVWVRGASMYPRI